MAFDGNGTFIRVHNWQEDSDNSIGINADRHDEEDDGFATGLSGCMTRDGQAAMTDNLPMGDNRITGMADAIAADDAATLGQVQSSTASYAAATGSANAYVVTLSPVPPALAAGQRYQFKANFLSTGAATLAVNGQAAKNIKIEGLFDLPPYAIKNGKIIEVEYDGTSFQPLNLDIASGTVEMWLSTTPKPGYLLLDGATSVGDSTSGATLANAYTEGLYRYLWDSVSDAKAPVATGRGATAAADFAAHKKITLPTSKDLSPYGIGSTISAAMATAGAATVAGAGTVAVTINAVTLSSSNIPALTGTLNASGGGSIGASNGTGSSTATKRLSGDGTTGDPLIVVNVGGAGSAFTPTGTATHTGSATSVLHPVFGCNFIVKI